MGNFSHIPNRKGKGAWESACLRFGDPSHRWRDRPRAYRGKLDPRFTGTGKGKTFTVEETNPDSFPGTTTATQPESGAQVAADTPANPPPVDTAPA